MEEEIITLDIIDPNNTSVEEATDFLIDNAITNHVEDRSRGGKSANVQDILKDEQEHHDTSTSDIIWVQLMVARDVLTRDGNAHWNEKIQVSLPDEILMRVLSFLPLSMLFQMRVVCKHWSTIIQSFAFSRMCLDVQAPSIAPHLAICYVYNRFCFRWTIYDKHERKWKTMRDFNGHFEEKRLQKQEIYVASRGLLCLLEVGDIDVIQSLTVWNPLTNKKLELPPIQSSWSFPLVRIMFHDAQRNSYKLMLSGNQNYHPDDARHSTTEIYNSDQGAWVQGGPLLPNLRFPFSNGALCNGIVYYFGSRPMTMYDILLMYDIKENEWREIEHMIPSNAYCTPYLFEYDGHLLTIMHLLSGPPIGIASCAIFKFNFQSNKWKMLIQMPHAIYMDFAYIGACVAFGKKMYITGNAPNQDLIVVVYCDKNGSWFRLPPCPIASSVDVIKRHTTFAFFPTMTNEEGFEYIERCL